MPKPAGNCPNCGAPIEFRFSSAVQTTCPYCNSILVRHDVDLAKVGEVADLPPDVSPIQLLTEGIYQNQAFQVVGRILYQYEQGAWNEWHCITHQGASLWLSDAMLEYAVSRQVETKQILPQKRQLRAGMKLELGGVKYEVTGVNKARYLGVQGELPFEYWDKQESVFADMRNNSGGFGTIDCSEEPPLLFLGEVVPFDSLRLKNLRQFEGW